ncbi:putative ACN9 family domain-containing protein [Paraphysoderma sedebokerense]|nr:putative ACN9 family domain-containing protein [Paraphysoderma sedebokerense]KAI9138905.1 putative ACN9 family domain-containing protein [Paraphysoderma sedebokerense]
MSSSSSKTSVIQLYRRILSLHRSLPGPIRYIGDNYVKSEWRRHQHVQDQKFLKGFVDEWNKYAEEIERQVQIGKLEGRGLKKEEIEKMNNQQIGQLYELQKEAKKPIEPV